MLILLKPSRVDLITRTILLYPPLFTSREVLILNEHPLKINYQYFAIKL